MTEMSMNKFSKGSLSRIDLLLRNEEMVKAGAKSVFIGVESSSQKVLDSLRKGIDVDSTRKTVAMLKRHGLQTHASYILGGLQDTPRTVHETIFRFVKDYFWG
jgi:anaerobic magnesium-protoporphyrin IX monomethyl ester cyclase